MRNQAVAEYLVCLILAGFIYLLVLYPAYLYSFNRLLFSSSLITVRENLQEISFLDYLKYEIGKIKYVEPELPFPNSTLPKKIIIECYHTNKYCCKLMIKAIFYDKYLKSNITAVTSYPGIICYKERILELKDEICSKLKIYHKVKMFGRYSQNRKPISICNVTNVTIVEIM